MVRSLTLLALLALATVFARETNPVSRVSFTEFGHLVLEVLSPNGTVKECEVYADSDTIKDILSEVPEENEFLVSAAELRAKISECLELNQNSVGSQSSLRRKRSILKGIYPGTLWCGKGNLAMGDSAAVGSLVEEDTCCRNHDQCLPKIQVGETKYGLTNDGSYTAFHCEKCDRVFYDCLKKVDSRHADLIGFTFFDVIDAKCFEEDYPLVCTTSWWFFESCERDTSKPKTLQLKEFPDDYTSWLPF